MTEVTTIKVQGQTVFFHELSDAEMVSALQTLPTTQVKILLLASQMARHESAQYESVRASMATRIRELRLAKGISQERLADLAGCHRTYIGMLERRKLKPSLQVLVAVAEALQTDVSNLIS
jgi:DNA-binding XRE family transcriptional regulator